MTTKAQERKALDQIRKIVEGLGENSYIGAAFSGCFEIAESNIDNDFSDSMKAKLESAEKDAEYFHQIANSEAADIQKKEAQIADLKAILADKDEHISQLITQKREAWAAAADEKKEVRIKTASVEQLKPFQKVEFHNADGFKFITIAEASGWTDSYKLDEIETLTIC